MKKLSVAVAIALAGLAAGFALAPGVANAAQRAVGPADARKPRECATPSIDRLQQWLASGEGTTVPATGSLLVPVRKDYVAKVTLLNAEWHVVVVWLGNQFEAQADLSQSRGFRLTYSATEDLYLQLRPASHWSGGDKWVTLVPSTHGRMVSRFFSFRPDAWTSLPELGTPAYSLASALPEARGFVFVGKTANKLEFRSLRIDGYVPPCL